jgi:hypothetical protein
MQIGLNLAAWAAHDDATTTCATTVSSGHRRRGPGLDGGRHALEHPVTQPSV